MEKLTFVQFLAHALVFLRKIWVTEIQAYPLWWENFKNGLQSPSSLYNLLPFECG